MRAAVVELLANGAKLDLDAWSVVKGRQLTFQGSLGYRTAIVKHEMIISFTQMAKFTI